MMNNDNKINRHPSLHFAADLKQICKPLQLLNIAYFAHVQIDQQGKFSALGLQPEFVKLYLEKGYHRYDIHMAQTQQKESYIIWDNIERVKESKQLYNDFMEFRIGHTFTICQKHNYHTEYFHFSAHLGHEYMNQQYLLHLHPLKQFINYFRDKIKIHKELKRAYEIKFSIPANDSGYFITGTTNIIPPDEYNHIIGTNRTFIDRNTYLTKMELKCLNYLSNGKKCSEIAKILSITPRTIKAHIQNIKSKLNCQNYFQLGQKYAQLKFPNE